MMLPGIVLALAVFANAGVSSGTLRVCDDVIAPITLDPLREFSEKNHTIVQQVFEGLVRFDSDGRIEPALASTWKRLDPLTVEFHLRRGVHFHDGEPLDAEAVRYSLLRFVDPKGGFPGAGFLNSIESVDAVDPMTVRVKTRFPDGILLHRLAGLVTIVPPGYIAEHGEEYFGANPVGTGPFRFVSRDASSIRLAANEAYWGGRPKLGGLSFSFVPTERQIPMLLHGDLDIVTELPGTATMQVMKSRLARVVKKETYYTPASSLNTASGPLADVRVRKALNFAVNIDELIRYDVLGNGKPIATFSMAGEIGHSAALRPYRVDIRRAKALLRAAGYPRGFHIKALVKVQGMRTMKILATQLARVGVIVDITPTTDAVAVFDMKKQPWDWIFAGCPDPMSHSFFIQSIFLSSLSPFSVTRDPEFDRRLSEMVSEIDPVLQQRKGEELDEYVHDRALGVFTYQRVKTYAVRRGIRFVPSVTGMPRFDRSEIDEITAN